MNWTEMTNDEKVQSIRQKVVEEDYSASMLAAEWGTTRNAIVGFVHRHKDEVGLRSPFDAARSRRREARKREREVVRPVKRPILRKAPASRPDLQISEAEIVVMNEPSPERVAFYELKSGHCRYPEWGNVTPPIDEMFFCGRKKIEGSSYCDLHRRKCAGAGTISERQATKGVPQT